MGAHGGGALIGAGGQAEGVARVVVEDRQRMTAAGAAGPAGFEVHLPQRVGVRMFEPLERPVAGRPPARGPGPRGDPGWH